MSDEKHGSDEGEDEGSWMPGEAGSSERDEWEDRHEGSERIESDAACKTRYDGLWWCKHIRLGHSLDRKSVV